MLAPQVEAATKRISEMQKEVEGLLNSAQAKALFDEVGAKRARYLDLRKTVLDKKKAGQNEEALALLNTSHAAGRRCVYRVDQEPGGSLHRPGRSRRCIGGGHGAIRGAIS